VLASGFSIPENNGWKVVVTSTADYVEVGEGEPLQNEAEPIESAGDRALRVRTLPMDIEQACIETVKAWYIARKRDQTAVSKSVGDLSITYARPNAGERPDALPFSALGLLGPWERVV